MGEGTEVVRVCLGETSAPRMNHGIEIAFEALPETWEEGHAVDVLFPDGSRIVLSAEPEAGPTTFAWLRAPHAAWHVRLEPVRPNVLVACFEGHLREILADEG